MKEGGLRCRSGIMDKMHAAQQFLYDRGIIKEQVSDKELLSLMEGKIGKSAMSIQILSELTEDDITKFIANNKMKSEEELKKMLNDGVDSRFKEICPELEGYLQGGDTSTTKSSLDPIPLHPQHKGNENHLDAKPLLVGGTLLLCLLGAIRKACGPRRQRPDQTTYAEMVSSDSDSELEEGYSLGI